MESSRKKGFSFGLTSGIITTLGLIVGLDSTTHSTLVVIGGILIIAIADACSDALGMHISQESTGTHTEKQIWESTIATFLSKFAFAMTFIFPVLFLPLSTAVIVSIIWGLSLICAFSFYMAKRQGVSPWEVVAEHLIIAVLVILATHFVCDWVGKTFGV